MHSLATMSLAAMALASTTLACNKVGGVRLTNYGFPDAGGIPAYRCVGGQRQESQPNGKTLLGNGSRDKPYAAAAAKGSNVFKECSLIYVPLLEKYFRIQDYCQNCLETGPNKRVDLYLIQANKNIGQTSCELAFGDFNYNGNPEKFEHEVIVNPGTFKLDTAPLFKNGKCFNKISDKHVYPNRDNKINCPANGNAKAAVAGADAVTDADVSDDMTGFSDPAPVAIDAEGRNKTEVATVETEKPGDIEDDGPKLRFFRV